MKDIQLGKIYGVATILMLHEKYWLGDRRKVTLPLYLYNKYWYYIHKGMHKLAMRYKQLAKNKGVEGVFKSPLAYKWITWKGVANGTT